MRSIRRASSTRRWVSPASSSPSSTAPPRAASSSRSPSRRSCRSVSSASAKASTTCGLSMPAISSRPCSRARRRRRNVLSLRADDMMRATERCHREIMIQFDHVGKRYAGGHEALRDVSFHVARGEMIFITGHSGAGKSTLLKLIALLERPSSGEVIVNDRNLNRLERRQIPFHRRSLGMIFQDFRLLQDRTIFDNVALPLVIAGEYDQREIGRRVRAVFVLVGFFGLVFFFLFVFFVGVLL